MDQGHLRLNARVKRANARQRLTTRARSVIHRGRFYVVEFYFDATDAVVTGYRNGRRIEGRDPL